MQIARSAFQAWMVPGEGWEHIGKEVQSLASVLWETWRA